MTHDGIYFFTQEMLYQMHKAIFLPLENDSKLDKNIRSRLSSVFCFAFCVTETLVCRIK